MLIEVTRLQAGDVALIATIDRSEHVDIEYGVIDGRLIERPVTMTEVPSWHPSGSGQHSVKAQIDFCASVIANGGVLLGAFDGAQPIGVAIVDPSFESRMAWLAFLHVDRQHRRRGVASGLWNAAIDIARDAGARSIYVSAAPTGSAVGFYLRQGCHLADPPHSELFAREPEDIHLVRSPL